MTDRYRRYDALAPQRRNLQGRHQIAAGDDREIDLPALEATQKPFACALGITEDDIGMCGAELRCEGRKFSRQDAGLDTDGDLATLTVACPSCASMHARDIIEDHVSPADEFPTEPRRCYTG